MPRKLRNPKTRNETPHPSSLVAAILLGGFGTPPLDGKQYRGFAGGFLDLATDEGIVALWREHEAHLRKEADRYGVKPSWEADDGLVFYAEYVKRTLRTGNDGIQFSGD